MNTEAENTIVVLATAIRKATPTNVLIEMLQERGVAVGALLSDDDLRETCKVRGLSVPKISDVGPTSTPEAPADWSDADLWEAIKDKAALLAAAAADELLWEAIHDKTQTVVENMSDLDMSEVLGGCDDGELWEGIGDKDATVQSNCGDLDLTSLMSECSDDELWDAVDDKDNIVCDWARNADASEYPDLLRVIAKRLEE